MVRRILSLKKRNGIVKRQLEATKMIFPAGGIGSGVRRSMR